MTHIADSLYSSLSHNARAVDSPKTPDPMMRIKDGIPLLVDMIKRSDVRRIGKIDQVKGWTERKVVVVDKKRF
jgi:hypothetical protein